MSSAGGGSPFKGACVFGTASGLAIRGVGCLAEPSRGLLRLLDFGTQKLKVGETVWFAMPFSIGPEHGRIVGQVGFASDFKGREGFVGVAIAVTDSMIKDTGFGGAVQMVEKLYPWFSQSFDATQGEATLAQADPILGQLQLPRTAAAEVPSHEEPVRIKLPENWEIFISRVELMGTLPGHKRFRRAVDQGYVLRTSPSSAHDIALDERFLSSWRRDLLQPNERLELLDELATIKDALNKTVGAFKEQQQYSSSLEADTAKKAQVIGSLESQVKAESQDRARLTRELAAKQTEAEAAAKAAQNLDAERKALQAQLDDAGKRLQDATTANKQLLDEYHANQARLKELDGQLKETQSKTMAKARAEVAREKQGLEATIAEQQRVLTEAAKKIEKLNFEKSDLGQRLADAQLTIGANQASDDAAGFRSGARTAEDEQEWQRIRQAARAGGGGTWNDGSQTEPKKGGVSSLLNVVAGLMIATVALFALWSSIGPFIPGHGGASDSSVLAENRTLKAKVETLEGELNGFKRVQFPKMKADNDELNRELAELRPRMKAFEEANQRYDVENKKLVAENARLASGRGPDIANMMRDLADATAEANKQATRANLAEASEKTAREVAAKFAADLKLATDEIARLKTEGLGAAKTGEKGQIPRPETIRGDVAGLGGKTQSSEPAPPQPAAAPPPPAVSAERCGMKPEYRKTVEQGVACAKANGQGDQCQDATNRATFASLAEDLPKCSMAASACADGVKRIQSADSDRKRKKYNWHSILAAAMDETLNCVEAAWARNLPGPAR